MFEDNLVILVTINDITNKKNTESELNNEREKYRLLAESMADVIWIFNLKFHKFSYFSPSIFDLRGFTVEEAMSQRFDETMPEKYVNKLMIDYKKNLEYFLSNPYEKQTYIHQFQQ
jgi:PAS domain S-box-containing protein